MQHREKNKERVHLHYGRDEEHMHFFTHLAGVVFILFFGRYLWQANDLDGSLQLGLVIYLITFLGVFLASSAYHLHYFRDHKHHLRKLDHSAIYFFIAGSNTPYLLGFTEGPAGLLFLIMMWLLVIAGLWMKWQERPIPDWMSLVYYLFMGWLGIVTMYLIFPRIQTVTLLLIIAGGLLYSIGAFFYRHDRIKWYHSIWHLLVLGAAVTHFMAIYVQLNES